MVTESGVIMQLLEDEFPDHRPLLPPAGSAAAGRVELLMRLERRFFSEWLGWLCGADPSAQRRFEALMDLVASEMAAAGGPFFLGPQLSLVDVTFAPMLERAAASLAYYKGFALRGAGRWPALDAWFAAMEARPTYMGTKSGARPLVWLFLPFFGGCFEGGRACQGGEGLARVDGRRWAFVSGEAC